MNFENSNLDKIMAFRNTSPSSKHSNSEEFDDIPIVPPKPIAQKEYKEEIPDISVVSVIADNAFQHQNFQRNFLRPQNRYNILNGDINRTSYQEQLRTNSCVPKTICKIAEQSNKIVDPTVLPFKLCATCESCAQNHSTRTNNRYNEKYEPKNRALIPLAIGNGQSDKEMRCKFEDGQVISSKFCCKHVDSNFTASLNHKSGTCNHAQLSDALNSNEPEISQIVNIPDSPSVDQLFKLRESISKSERHENKLLCPGCFKKNCKCDFLGRKHNDLLKNSYNCTQVTEKPSGIASDDLSSIWEYLKRQDEKINSIQKQVSNFLSQHASCCADQTTQKKELLNVKEHDIPYILSILTDHKDKITELQDEIKFLKSRQQKSSPANNKSDECILSQGQLINCLNEENCNEEIHSPSCNIVCHEERQTVTKTSTSTMTSFAIENDEKFVYCKQLTVVTDIMGQKKESSCLSEENDTPTTKNNLNGKNVKSNTQKRKSHKPDKCSPILKCKTGVSSNSSSDVTDSIGKPVLKTSHKSERKSKQDSAGNKVKDKRCIDDCASDNDVEEQLNSPAQKTDARKSNSRSSKQKPRNWTSPKVADRATIRNPRNKAITRQISSSSTDTESKEEMFDKLELYSEDERPCFSVATVKYLNKYGLNHHK